MACPGTNQTKEGIWAVSPMAIHFQAPDGARDEQRMTVTFVNTGPGLMDIREIRVDENDEVKKFSLTC